MDDLPHKHPGSLLIMLENNRCCHLYTATTHGSLLNQREMEPAKSRGLQKPPFKHGQHRVNIIPGIGMVSTKGIHVLSRELVLNITTPLRRNCLATTLATTVSPLLNQNKSVSFSTVAGWVKDQTNTYFPEAVHSERKIEKWRHSCPLMDSATVPSSRSTKTHSKMQ